MNPATTMPRYPRESDEFQAATITVDGSAVTTGVQLAVVADGARPSGWADPVPLDGKIGVMTGGRQPGHYRVWAKVTSNPETPVIDCGTFQVT